MTPRTTKFFLLPYACLDETLELVKGTVKPYSFHGHTPDTVKLTIPSWTYMLPMHTYEKMWRCRDIVLRKKSEQGVKNPKAVCNENPAVARVIQITQKTDPALYQTLVARAARGY